MKVAVVEFEGSHGAQEAVAAVRSSGGEAMCVWHLRESLDSFDAAIIPGGAAFGDYLRPGALARCSPIAAGIKKFALSGKPLFGIGNGFQILCELGLLPGVFLINPNERFYQGEVGLVVEKSPPIFATKLQPGQTITLPVACQFGRYYLDRRTLQDVEELGLVVLRYCDQLGEAVTENAPFLAVHGIAALRNREGNVFGILARPERAIGDVTSMGSDGLEFFRAFAGA